MGKIRRSKTLVGAIACTIIGLAIPQAAFSNSFNLVLYFSENIILIALLLLPFVCIGAIIYAIFKYKAQSKIIADLKTQLGDLQKQTLQSAREWKKLMTILNHAENAIAIAQPDGNIQWINQGFVNLYSYKLDELNDLQQANLFTLAGDKYTDYFEQCLSNKESIIFPFNAFTKHKRKIWLLRNLIPILDETGTVTNLIAIDSDTTDTKLALNEVKQQKKEIERQSKELEKTNHEIEKQRDIARKQKQNITDSIVYAKRIQEALLPPPDYINELLPEYFVLFKPRDIVSGDFYWIGRRELPNKKLNEIIVVAADCTGHGVPGAFMSMLGISFLNEIVIKSADHADSGQLKANEILNRLRDNVIKVLRQTGKEGEAKDGMDLSLCIVDFDNHRIQYAGANNPLYRITHHGDETELIHYKPDSMPIGIYRFAKETFTNHEIEMKKGDSFYIFTDGYCDQFGGDKGRRFLAGRFKEMLLDIHEQPMPEQKDILNFNVEHWKSFPDKHGKPHEQLDDILVIGFRV